MKTVTRTCPICGSNDESKIFAEANLDEKKLDGFAFASRKKPEYMHYRLVWCLRCDLIYANPAPTQDTLANAYQKADFNSSEESHFASRVYGSLLAEIIDKLSDLDGAMDIGTGDGAFLEQLLARGFTGVVGVEPSESPIMAARPDIRPLIKRGVFNPQDFKPGSFSLITCFQTLEHIYNPLEICETFYRLLKNGGAVFLICHNFRSYSAKLLGMKSPIFDVEHMQLFSPKSVRATLEKCGFRVIQVKVIANTYPLRYWVKLFPFRESFKAACLSALNKTGLGSLPVPVFAGNIAVIGYK